MVAGRASMRFLDACHWPGSHLVLFIGSSIDSRSSPTVAWCCSCTYHRDQIDSLLACLINADACDAWPACRDSPHAFPVVLFAASNSHVCVPDCFSFVSFFSFQWSSFFLFLSPYTSFVREVPEDGSMLCRVEIELPLTHFPCSLRQIFFWAYPQPTQTSAYEQAVLQAILC